MIKQPSLIMGGDTYSSASRKEWKCMQENSIKEWHFEWAEDGRGVVPVKGKFDENNPKHARRGR